MNLRLKHAGRVAGYTVLFVGIIVATIVLVAYGQGYVYNQETGEITGGGLFLIDSRPSGADIFIDGEHRGTTQKRIRLPVGEYTVEMYRQGHRPWSKELPIRETKANHVEYPILVPDTLSTAPVGTLDEVRLVSQSNEQRYVAVAETRAGRDRLRVFPAATPDTSYVVFTAPDSLPEAAITDVEWSPEADQGLVTVSSETETRQYVFNPATKRSSSASRTSLGVPLRRPVFSRSSSRVYGVDGDGALRRLDPGGGTGAILATNVSAFAVAEGAVYAVQPRQGSSRLVRIEDGNARLVRTYSPNPFHLERFRYDNEEYLLVHNEARRQATLMNISADPRSTNTTSLPVGAAESVTVNPGGRFVVMHTGESFTAYDMRWQTMHRFQIPGLDSEPHWYTDHHLLAASDNGVVMFEFDGGNQEYLTEATQFPVYGNSDRNAVYSIQRNHITDRLQLQLTRLE